MKTILIMTLQQGKNYGGMLQAYALQTSLRKQGYAVETSWTRGSYIRRIMAQIPGLKWAARVVRNKKKPADMATVTANTRQFVDTYVKTVSFDRAFFGVRRGRYYACIVGSDQVWRRAYTYIPHNLLSFVRGDVVRLSYAASFGKDDLSEYDDKLIVKSKKLAQRFDAVSVREDTGLEIARERWGVSAEHHVDPTLLIGAKEYSSLIDKDFLPTYEPDGQIFSYVLDKADEKQNIVAKVADALSLESFRVIDSDENDGRAMPPVTQWLRSFRDAEYVVTDSFHGMVFSIIFNKPFLAIGNKDRGLARFQSLLQIFNLEDRLVESTNGVTDELIKQPIDWKNVNKKIAAEQARSFEYLKRYLG